MKSKVILIEVEVADNFSNRELRELYAACPPATDVTVLQVQVNNIKGPTRAKKGKASK